jgi:hypothetical protein
MTPAPTTATERITWKVYQPAVGAAVERTSGPVRQVGPPSPGTLIELEKNGDPADKVDLLLLGDGYTAAERKKFEADSKRLLAVLFATSPFKERRKDFNVWGLVPAAAQSGISRPSTEQGPAMIASSRPPTEQFARSPMLMTLEPLANSREASL